jgi:hypothetical protein
MAGAATVCGAVVLAAGSGFAAPVPGPVVGSTPAAPPTPVATTTCTPEPVPVLGAAPGARPRVGARPARGACSGTAAPDRAGAGTPVRRVGRSSPGPGSTGQAGRKASTARGRAAKRAVHDGPVVIARRAITTRIAAASSGPVLPLGLAAGLLLVAGGVLGVRRRRPR